MLINVFPFRKVLMIATEILIIMIMEFCFLELLNLVLMEFALQIVSVIKYNLLINCA